MAPPGRCPGFLLGPFPGRPEPEARHPSPDCPAPSPRQGPLPAPGPLPTRRPVGGPGQGMCAPHCHTLGTHTPAHAGTRHTCEATRGSQWGCRSRRVASSRGPTSPRAGRRRGEADLSSKTRLGSRRPRSPEPGLRGPGEGPTLPVCLLAGGREEGQGSVGLGFRGHAGLRGRPEQL